MVPKKPSAETATCARDRLSTRTAVRHLGVVAEEPTKSLVVRMPPPEAERVAGWVGIDLVPLGGGQIVGCLQETGTKRDGVGVGARWVVDVQIQMDLLRASIRPIRRDVVRRELNADRPPTVRVDNAVERVVSEHAAAEHSRPEGTFGCQVSRIKYDYLSHDLHTDILARARIADCAGRHGSSPVAVLQRRVMDALCVTSSHLRDRPVLVPTGARSSRPPSRSDRGTDEN